MSITGIESLVYGVENVPKSTDFFADFGLRLVQSSPEGSSFRLPESSNVVIRHHEDSLLPKSQLVGFGVREVIWAMDSASALDVLVRNLSVDHEVHRDADGTAHFVTAFGVAMGLRVASRHPVLCAPDPVNAPDRVNRLNQHRKWRQRAFPKVIAHVVFSVPDYLEGAQFMRERLGFRLSDSQRGFGMYLRADGSHNHHNLLLLNANAPLPDADGRPRFHHANFGVEDIDEIMVGANYMVRKGWTPSHFGLGRHRIDSALFYYIPCPAGGEAEYGADADYVDDSWVPRNWPEPLFAYSHFVHNLPGFLMQPPAWTIEYLTGEDPTHSGES